MQEFDFLLLSYHLRIAVSFLKELSMISATSHSLSNHSVLQVLKNKQVIGICNFAEKNIAGVVSQVLILGAIDQEGKVVLLHPSQKTEDGLPIA